MELTFLGTGASTSRTRHNCAAAVDGQLLLDAGAPLVVQLTKAGLDPDAIETILISHGHGDHIVGLGTFLIDRVLTAGPRLRIVGPVGLDEQLEQLCRILWGDNWRRMAGGGFELELLAVTAGDAFTACGYEVEVVQIEHDDGHFHAVRSVGYIVDDGNVRLGFTGDSAPGPWVDKLLERCDAAIVECTGPDPGPTHLSEDYVRELIQRHPNTELVVTHFWKDTPLIDGATVAEDLGRVQIRPRSIARKSIG